MGAAFSIVMQMEATVALCECECQCECVSNTKWAIHELIENETVIVDVAYKYM